jgi:hypothetical protein
MGLRKFSLVNFLKKNFNFITGILSEIGLTLLIIAVAMFICLLLVFIKSAP